MRLGLIFLVVAYVLSQFYRAFLAVLTPVLETEIGATADDLAIASGLWFLVFALMQIPVGWALDTIGPKRTAGILLALGAAGGAFVFAAATSPAHISIAMVLIGIGCSPVLMSSYYIFAKVYPPAVFATLAGAVIGIGSLGNLAGSVPMAWAVETLGWRETLAGLGAVTLAVAIALMVFIQDPPKDESAPKGSVLDLLRIPALWLIFPLMFVNYAPSAGIRGLWIGPYLSDVYALDALGIGQITLVMGLAMILGNFVYGPLDRILPSRKWIVFIGNALGALACFALYQTPAGTLTYSAFLLAAIGFFGASFPVVIAHAREFFPSHLTGRGVTLLNLFGIGGVGIMQVVTGRVHGANQGAPADPYQAIFLMFGLLVVAGLTIYVFAKEHPVSTRKG